MSNDTFGGERSVLRRPWLLVALAVVLFFEATMLAAVALFLVYELVTEVPASFASAIAILILVIVAGVWLVVVGVGTLRARPWVRSAALTWQVLQIAVAVGSFQGLFARGDIGWLLLVPAVVAIALLFTRSVMTATRRL